MLEEVVHIKLKITRKNILLCLIMLWSLVSIIFYWMPYLFTALQSNKDLQYEIIGGYVSKPYLEKYIYSHIFLWVISMICILYLIITCILSLTKALIVRYIGIGITIQTLFMKLLEFWSNNLIDANYYADMATENISFQCWIIISVIACIVVCILYFFCCKISFMILLTSSILQICNTIDLFKSNIDFLIQEKITTPGYMLIVFQCINGIFVYIIYWFLIIDSISLNRRE